jgi:hypothetical protein
MNLDEVHLFDLYVPLVAGVERELDYAEGGKMILASLTPLGDDYGRRLAEVVDPRNGMIDVYPARTKDSGAFSAAVYGVHPYIKMNFQNSYNDVSTLAHELGHALHAMLSIEHQPYLTSRYAMFIAEIASTCNQVLLSKYMIAHATSDAERAWYLGKLSSPSSSCGRTSSPKRENRSPPNASTRFMSSFWWITMGPDTPSMPMIPSSGRTFRTSTTSTTYSPMPPVSRPELRSRSASRQATRPPATPTWRC